MPDISNHDLPFSIKTLMVFVIRGDKDIRPGTNSLAQQEASRSATDGYPLHSSFHRRRITDAACIHFLLHFPKKLHQRHFLRKRSHHRSEEHTSELQSLMRISYAVFCLKKKTNIIQ